MRIFPTAIFVLMEERGTRGLKLSEVKSALLDLGPHVTFDTEHYLRERPRDVEEFEKLIDHANMYLRQAFQEKNVSKDVFIYLYSYLGNAYRISYQSRKAIQYLSKAYQFAKELPNEREETRALIRLGEAYKYDDQHEQALDCFERALLLTQTSALSSYRDFALQHMGKCFMELGEYDNALLRLEEAFTLRKKKKDPHLILSTEMAIVMVHVLMRQSDYAELD